MFNVNRLENENEEQYIFRLGQAKDNGQIDLSWEEIANLVNSFFRSDESEYRTEAAYRKPYQYIRNFIQAGAVKQYEDADAYSIALEKQKEDIRKERIKLQTANIERNRLDRSESRQEMYYEYVGSMIDTLPLPDFEPLCGEYKDMEYLVTIADVHYGAKFTSINNVYSPEIAKKRFEYLCGELIDFVTSHDLRVISVACLGDVLQGLLRVSDLKINDSSVVKATVEVSRIIASFLNELSKYVEVNYYHVPTANHTQTRSLGTKASELADEDLEYIVGNYISDLCGANNRINVYLANEGAEFIQIPMFGWEVLAMHGHQLKNVESSLRDISMLRRRFVDYLILGHYHNGKEIPCSESPNSDTEILISPSFIGSDPYSDSLLRGCKAAVKIYGFDKYKGHTETYKIILN